MYRFLSFLELLQLKILRATSFIWYLEELENTSFLLTMMMESLHCCNGWWTIGGTCSSCMLIFDNCFHIPGFWMLIAFYCCRSALQAFKRRVAYSNVGHDRILTSLLKLACSNKHCLKFFFHNWMLIKILLGGEHHQSEKILNYPR